MVSLTLTDPLLRSCAQICHDANADHLPKLCHVIQDRAELAGAGRSNGALRTLQNRLVSRRPQAEG
jgi:hypothetical protein